MTGVQTCALPISEDELKRILGGLQAQARQRSVLDRRIASLKKLRAAENALALNASAPGVQVLESGIQIRRMVPGTETAPISRSTMLGYVLRLLDGREIERIEAVAHDAAPLPPGLREVLALMPQGARWMVWLPPQWAYGAAGRPPMIDGNEAVVVEITRIPDSPS